MYSDYNKVAAKEIDGFKYVCNKILQAYRIRMKLFMRRHELVMSIEKNFDNVANNPKFYTSLDNILKKEKKLLEIIEGDEKKVGNNLVYALKQLKKYDHELGGELNDIRLPHVKKKISGKNVSIFLRRMISLLNKMERDLKIIEKRIHLENVFIKERNAKHFDKFIKAWNEEMKAYEKMLKDLKLALNTSKKLIVSTESTLGDGVMNSGGVGLVGSVAAGIGLKQVVIGVLGGTIGVSVVMVGFIFNLVEILDTGRQAVWREENLIAEFEKKRRMETHPFLYKIFG